MHVNFYYSLIIIIIIYLFVSKSSLSQQNIRMKLSPREMMTCMLLLQPSILSLWCGVFHGFDVHRSRVVFHGFGAWRSRVCMRIANVKRKDTV